MPFMTGIRGARPAGAALLLLTLGCADEELVLPPIVYEGEHFYYATNLERPLCAATLTAQDEFTELLQGILGPPVMDRKYIYYEMTEEEFAAGPCPDVVACYDPSTWRIYTTDILHYHEIVHAVNDLAIGLAHKFLIEGLAEVFRDRQGPNEKLRSSAAGGLEWSAGRLPYDLYARAGHFMAYLFDTFGEEKVVSLLTRTRRDQGFAERQGILEAVTEMQYAELLEDYAAYPECDHLTYRWPLLECAAAPVAWTGCAWETSIELGCEADGVLGPRRGEIWTSRSVEIPNNGVHLVSVSGDPATTAFVEFGRCTVGCREGRYHRFNPGDDQEVVLRRGTYYITLVRGEDEPGELGFRIEPRGYECGDEPPAPKNP